jgi:predicted RNA methylase
MSIISELWHGIARHGVRGALTLLPKNLRYLAHRTLESCIDHWYRIDTTSGVRGMVDVSTLPVIGENRSSASPYAVTPYLTLFRLFHSLPIDLPRYSFIDFGSGKGRVLLLAAQHSFRDVVGIEFAPVLHEAAAANIRSYRGPRECRAVRPLLMDVADFEIPTGSCVLFFFNPFGPAVMHRVAENVAVRFDKSGDHMLVALYNQTVFGAFEQYPIFRKAYEIAEHPFDSFGHSARYRITVLEAGEPVADGTRRDSPLKARLGETS